MRSFSVILNDLQKEARSPEEIAHFKKLQLYIKRNATANLVHHITHIAPSLWQSLTGIHSAYSKLLRELQQHYIVSSPEDRLERQDRLMSAMSKGELGAVKKALENGARGIINEPIEKEEGDTPLVMALSSENIKLIKLLLENGASCDSDQLIRLSKKRLTTQGKPIHWETALHLACELGLNEWVPELLANGADPNIAREEDDATPLHLAIMKKDPDLCALLLNKGADPGKEHNGLRTTTGYSLRGGCTAFSLAIEEKQPQIAHMMLQKGYVFNQTDMETAIAYSKWYKDTSIRELVHEMKQPFKSRKKPLCFFLPSNIIYSPCKIKRMRLSLISMTHLYANYVLKTANKKKFYCRT